ncbi:MAG: putative Ig domain-containing protein, partial [Acidobacteria bacterium]|nr:putative Ig domain-containing protein [Acidobacteriota bacterium]
YSWSIASGSLPAGLALSTGGAITGTPAAAGTFTFTARVTDSASQPATQALQIVINPAATPPTITTTSLPAGTVGVAYSQSLAASGWDAAVLVVDCVRLAAGRPGALERRRDHGHAGHRRILQLYCAGKRFERPECRETPRDHGCPGTVGCVLPGSYRSGWNRLFLDCDGCGGHAALHMVLYLRTAPAGPRSHSLDGDAERNAGGAGSLLLHAAGG